jgi:nitrate reductase NapE component
MIACFITMSILLLIAAFTGIATILNSSVSFSFAWFPLPEVLPVVPVLLLVYYCYQNQKNVLLYLQMIAFLFFLLFLGMIGCYHFIIFILLLLFITPVMNCLLWKYYFH